MKLKFQAKIVFQNGILKIELFQKLFRSLLLQY